MKHQTKLGTGLKYVGVGTLLWGLFTPWAVAGPEQDTELAEMEFARGNMIVSLALWTKAAQLGYAPAQARLGDMLDKSEEDAIAVDWYRKAADQGNAAGDYGLGQMYAKGEGVKKDIELARSHTLRAAEKGHREAVRMMKDAYRSGGLGLAVDKAQADVWEAKFIALAPPVKSATVKGAPVNNKQKAEKVNGK